MEIGQQSCSDLNFLTGINPSLHYHAFKVSHMRAKTLPYSTLTTLAKLRGMSGFNPLAMESSYDKSCNGIIANKSR